jgi:NAD(P)-dependent dehydrogenase (short-subunit alcohol dehydrogenase family)
MLLENENAVTYGGGGAIGSAVTSTFAREGARVFLAGPHPPQACQGGPGDFRPQESKRDVNEHADAVAASAGGINLALNAAGIFQWRERRDCTPST